MPFLYTTIWNNPLATFTGAFRRSSSGSRTIFDGKRDVRFALLERSIPMRRHDFSQSELQQQRARRTWEDFYSSVERRGQTTLIDTAGQARRSRMVILVQYEGSILIETSTTQLNRARRCGRLARCMRSLTAVLGRSNSCLTYTSVKVSAPSTLVLISCLPRRVNPLRVCPSNPALPWGHVSSRAPAAILNLLNKRLVTSHSGVRAFFPVVVVDIHRVDAVLSLCEAWNTVHRLRPAWSYRRSFELTEEVDC